eukprot:CAMPEP_0179423728 /NCGR_PEP_ID=MMETSP0799-20121207/11179_1 /TAXON_ID=46947 /ORGANISM="Geminigera cryophila, Strain CCMP2564" /LENGTH=316 /DNA_ID=CAMNT_0021198071 /DNA_START=35 /DNA_END=985 /DNA_ORIENTATION=+
MPTDAPASFAPPKSATAINPNDAQRLADFLRPGGVLCITGAGISTESGIPDYRGPNGSYSKGHVPMQHMEFMTQEEKRKRYWARSLIGYRYFYSRKPNTAHFDLAALQKAHFVRGLITQNVDTLHTQAGSSSVIDLHGANDTVACQSCGATEKRNKYQSNVESLNSEWVSANLAASKSQVESRDIRADGDAHLSQDDFRLFQVPACTECGGVMMPTVVFFGGSIPKATKDLARSFISDASRLLVLGSSCEVGSIFHLIKGSLKSGNKQGHELAIVNMGPTRLERDIPALVHGHLKIEAGCSDSLRAACDLLGVTSQ